MSSPAPVIIIYSFVARGTTVLCENSGNFTGNFSQVREETRGGQRRGRSKSDGSLFSFSTSSCFDRTLFCFPSPSAPSPPRCLSPFSCFKTDRDAVPRQGRSPPGGHRRRRKRSKRRRRRRRRRRRSRRPRPRCRRRPVDLFGSEPAFSFFLLVFVVVRGPESPPHLHLRQAPLQLPRGAGDSGPHLLRRLPRERREGAAVCVPRARRVRLPLEERGCLLSSPARLAARARSGPRLRPAPRPRRRSRLATPGVGVEGGRGAEAGRRGPGRHGREHRASPGAGREARAPGRQDGRSEGPGSEVPGVREGAEAEDVVEREFFFWSGGAFSSGRSSEKKRRKKNSENIHKKKLSRLSLELEKNSKTSKQNMKMRLMVGALIASLLLVVFASVCFSGGNCLSSRKN